MKDCKKDLVDAVKTAILAHAHSSIEDRLLDVGISCYLRLGRARSTVLTCLGLQLPIVGNFSYRGTIVNE